MDSIIFDILEPMNNVESKNVTKSLPPSNIDSPP